MRVINLQGRMEDLGLTAVETEKEFQAVLKWGEAIAIPPYYLKKMSKTLDVNKFSHEELQKALCVNDVFFDSISVGSALDFNGDVSEAERYLSKKKDPFLVFGDSLTSVIPKNGSSVKSEFTLRWTDESETTIDVRGLANFLASGATVIESSSKLDEFLSGEKIRARTDLLWSLCKNPGGASEVEDKIIKGRVQEAIEKTFPGRTEIFNCYQFEKVPKRNLELFADELYRRAGDPFGVYAVKDNCERFWHIKGCSGFDGKILKLESNDGEEKEISSKGLAERIWEYRDQSVKVILFFPYENCKKRRRGLEKTVDLSYWPSGVSHYHDFKRFGKNEKAFQSCDLGSFYIPGERYFGNARDFKRSKYVSKKASGGCFFSALSGLCASYGIKTSEEELRFIYLEKKERYSTFDCAFGFFKEEFDFNGREQFAKIKAKHLIIDNPTKDDVVGLYHDHGRAVIDAMDDHSVLLVEVSEDGETLTIEEWGMSYKISTDAFLSRLRSTYEHCGVRKRVSLKTTFIVGV